MNAGKSIGIACPTEYGMMIIPRWDINQSMPLFKRGISLEHEEIGVLQKIAQRMQGNCVYADVGANLGTHTLAVAPFCKEVHSFEAQRVIFNCLAGSVALSNHRHVFVHNKAVSNIDGKLVGVPVVNYWAEGQFGGISFKGPTKDRPEPIGDELVETVSIDSFQWPQLDLLKIDVEGMEREVLEGAEQTLKRCRPIMLVEHLQMDVDKARPLPQWLVERGYDVHPAGMNLVCIPVELRDTLKIEIKEGNPR